MPSQPITMRKIREVIRLRFECKLSLDAIARALSLSKGVVAKYVKAVEQQDASWEALAGLDDRALSLALLSRTAPAATRASQFTPADYAWVHQELKRKGVTLQLLWEEYQAQCTGRAWGYTSFCVHYRAWLASLKRSMRQIHRAEIGRAHV